MNLIQHSKNHILSEAIPVGEHNKINTKEVFRTLNEKGHAFTRFSYGGKHPWKKPKSERGLRASLTHRLKTKRGRIMKWKLIGGTNNITLFQCPTCKEVRIVVNGGRPTTLCEDCK